MTVALGSDHAGYQYKESIKKYLETLGHQILDFGTDSEEVCDYPDYIRPAAESVASGSSDFGIVFGGSGNGEAIVANKIKGIRCALCWSEQTAEWGKAHNNANMIALGARTVSIELARSIVEKWLNTSFEGGRHVQRIDKIEKADE